MIIDWTKPVQTRYGDKVRIYTIQGVFPYCVVGQRRIGYSNIWVAQDWTIDGDAQDDASFDLVNVPEERWEIRIGCEWREADFDPHVCGLHYVPEGATHYGLHPYRGPTFFRKVVE